jgi:hypothetical protein
MMGADNAATPSAAAQSATAGSADPEHKSPSYKEGARTIAEVTPDKLVHELDEARMMALDRGQASAAVNATLAKARLAGLVNERGESIADPPAKFDGNYAEAARRISLVLRLASEQTASGQRFFPQHRGDHGDLANVLTAADKRNEPLCGQIHRTPERRHTTSAG